MNNIYYMWEFKPNENTLINQDVINTNLKYIENYKIITPTIFEPLLQTNIFPNLLELYNLIPNWIIKADLGRLLLVYFFGGIYCDTDCFIQTQFNNMTDNINLYLFTEHVVKYRFLLGKRECKDNDNLVRVANFCFGSKIKNHPFLKEVIDECLNRLKQILVTEGQTKLNNRDILWVCGPDVITTIYHSSKHKYNDILLHNSTFLYHSANGEWRK